MPVKWYNPSHTVSNCMRGGDPFVEELISIPETAERLKVSETIVRRLMSRGDLVPAKTETIGKQVRRYFRASEVEALRQKRSGAGTV